MRSWQGAQSSSLGAPGRGAKKGGCKGNRVSPGLIGHQAYPRSYLPLQPSPAPLSGTLLGIVSVWASVCLPRPQPKFLGVEGLGGSGSTQNHRASCGKKNLGRQPPSGQWHWTGQVTMAEEGRRGWAAVRPAATDVPSSIYPEPGWSSTPQGPGSLCPALPLTEIPLDWPAASPSIGLVN